MNAVTEKKYNRNTRIIQAVVFIALTYIWFLLQSCSMEIKIEADGKIGVEEKHYICNECGHDWYSVSSVVCTSVDCDSMNIEIIKE